MIRSRFLFAALVVGFLGVAFSATAATNLVPNPSLSIEGYHGPQNWELSSWGDLDQTTTYPVPGNGDNYAAQVSISRINGEGDINWHFRPVTVEAGKTYRWSGDYKSNANTWLVASFITGTGSTTYQDLKMLPPSVDWTRAEAEFTVPNNATEVTVSHLLAEVGELTIDNQSLELVAVPDITPPELTLKTCDPAVDPVCLQADTNRDGLLTLADLDHIRSHFNCKVSVNPSCAQDDVNRDKVINIADMAMMKAMFSNLAIVYKGGQYIDAGAQASDDRDGNISGQIVVDSSNIDTSKTGNYYVNYSVKDAAGNTATIGRMVKVLPLPKF